MTVEVTDDDLVTIASFVDYILANVSKTKLQSEGIDCWLADDTIVTLNWLYSNMYGGVKLKVRESDAQRANTILRAVKSDLPKTRLSPQVERKLFFGKISRRSFFLVWVAILIAEVVLEVGFSILAGIQQLLNAR